MDARVRTSLGGGAPKTQDRWWAQKGAGSFHNGQKMQVSAISELEKAQIFHGSLYGPEAKTTPPTLLTLLSRSYRQRGVGDYLAHMFVAMGAGEAGIDFGLKAWDIAPIKVIVEEAGGTCSDARGQNSIYSPSLVTSNTKLHHQVLEILDADSISSSI